MNEQDNKQQTEEFSTDKLVEFLRKDMIQQTNFEELKNDLQEYVNSGGESAGVPYIMQKLELFTNTLNSQGGEVSKDTLELLMKVYNTAMMITDISSRSILYVTTLSEYRNALDNCTMDSNVFNELNSSIPMNIEILLNNDSWQSYLVKSYTTTHVKWSKVGYRYEPAIFEDLSIDAKDRDEKLARLHYYVLAISHFINEGYLFKSGDGVSEEALASVVETVERLCKDLEIPLEKIGLSKETLAGLEILRLKRIVVEVEKGLTGCENGIQNLVNANVNAMDRAKSSQKLFTQQIKSVKNKKGELLKKLSNCQKALTTKQAELNS